MSIFYCHRCDNLRDADEEDNTGETPDGMGLICSACMEDAEADLEDMIYAHGQEATL